VIERTIDDVLREHHDEILTAARARLRDDETMAHLAAQREMGESEMVGEVIGFWLQAIGTDLALGSTAAIEQNLGWLVRLRAGQDLPFADALVSRMFDEIADEIDARLPSATMHEQFGGYRLEVHGLISAAFPAAGGGAS
jgi:hypothetical protein